jgi:hypothetical protein
MAWHVFLRTVEEERAKFAATIEQASNMRLQ